MKRLLLAAAVLALAVLLGHTIRSSHGPRPAAQPFAPGQAVRPSVQPTVPAPVRLAPSCVSGRVLPLGSSGRAYVGVAGDGAAALAKPGGRLVARFGRVNANDYPTVFGVVGVVKDARCDPDWYRVQLPIRPNGATGYVAARSLRLAVVRTRIDVNLSTRRLTLYRAGRTVLSSAVAVGAAATPTPTGRYYVNQRLIPSDTSGPFGPGALGISAFSPVLTGWIQGGPVAIHGTNEPWSIGRAVSNGCIRLPNATLQRVFSLAAAGTPVIIHL